MRKGICSLTRVLELPSNDVVPLVQLQRQIAMTLDPFCVVFISTSA